MKTRLLAVASWLFVASQPLQSQEAPSYARHVRPFLAKYCVECHNLKAFKAGLDLETYKSMLEGSDRGAVVVPGKPAESKMVLLLDGKNKPVMPPKSAKHQPTSAEIAKARAWVAAGAKDDSELVKVVIPDIKPRAEVAAPVTKLAYRGQTWYAGRGEEITYHSRVPDVVDSDGFRSKGPPGSRITALAFSKKSAILAYGRPGETPFLDNDVLKAPVNSGHKDSILALAFSPDGKTFVSASYDSQIKLWSYPNITELRTLKEHSDSVYSIAFSPDGKLLASCSADRTVKLWEVATGNLLYTLGESTDWLYALAWSPDGKHLASGGVDKSIRVYSVNAQQGKLLQSVFAHEGPVLKLVYSRDSQTLFSLGQDNVAKAWDAQRMVEKKVYPRQAESVLSLAIDHDAEQVALGRHDGMVIVLDADTGKVIQQIAPPKKKVDGKKGKAPEPKEEASLYRFPTVKEQEPNNSPGSGQKITLPATVQGSLEKAGENDFYRFEATPGLQLGVHLVPAKPGNDPKVPKLEPVLQLLDAEGRLLVESNEGFLGHTFANKGVYALGVRDRELRGGPSMTYQLHLGNIPVITAIFPIGLQRGTEANIQVEGVNLGTDKVHVKIPADAAPGSKVALGLKTVSGAPLGNQQVVVGEFADVMAAGAMSVPGTGNGRLLTPGASDTWTFAAKKGQKLIVEVEARRLGSALDSVLDILDEQNKPVERVVLRCQAKTNVTFRDHDSAVAGIRIEAWGELAVNDYIFAGSELMKIKNLPTHPDADCNFFTEAGQRIGFLDTTPTHHANGVPMYKVGLHPPGMTFPPNGFPVFTLNYHNDDGGPGFGRDSRIYFDPPADGIYRARVQDARGQAGPTFAYRLTVRPPRPGFNIRFNPTNPVVARGGATPLTISADRIDGYQGPIHVHFANVPAGLHLPDTTILPEENSTAVAFYASPEAMDSGKTAPLKLQAHAVIDGLKIVKEAAGDAPKLMDPSDIMAFTDEEQVVVKPGGQVKLTLHIDRRNGFLGRVPIEVRGLPHGVRVLDIGLNGILITEREVRRTMVLYAEPWVQPLSHPIVVLAKREGKNSEHAAKSIVLKVAETTEKGTGRAMTFAKDDLDKVPTSWKADHTGKGGGVWKVVADATAPSKSGHVLAQTGESPGPVYNLCVANDTSFKDVESTVSFKANKGKKDQGGGIVWRYVDANNYYIARFNPLEDNYRLYKVVAGQRTQLATKEDVTVPAGAWHMLTIKMTGDRIECYLDGKKLLEAQDGTFAKAGKVGLWTKADAQTSFDLFIISENKK